MEINGIIKNIKYRNIDGWSVFSLEERCSGIVTNCTGILSNIIDVDTEVDCEGKFVNSKFGKQLKCSSVLPKPIKTDNAAGVIAILQRLPGVGPVKAKKAVSEYGYKFAWRIAQECPSMLGITKFDLCLAAQEKAVRMGSSVDYKATLYLLSIGLTDHQANRIIETYGAAKAPSIIKENPYRIMTDIDGFGFKKADGVALKAGVKPSSTARINACVMYCLTSSEVNDGNIWLNGKYLIKQIGRAHV